MKLEDLDKVAALKTELDALTKMLDHKNYARYRITLHDLTGDDGAEPARNGHLEYIVPNVSVLVPSPQIKEFIRDRRHDDAMTLQRLGVKLEGVA